MLERIRIQLLALPAAERKVAEQVLAQPHAVTQATVAEIATRAGVSQPTVIRFSRSMGCIGLSDFRQRLASSLACGVPFIHACVDAEDSSADIANKVFDNTIAALLKCRNEVNAVRVEQAVDLLARAQRIEFYGLGNSGIIAADAQHKFFRFGTPTVAYSDAHIQTMAAAILSAGDVMVAISNSGRSVEILDTARIALSTGASVLAITASGSPLARMATVTLSADTHEDAETCSPMVSRIAHLVLIDILAVGVALRQGPELIARLKKTKDSLRGKRLRNY